MSLEAELDRIYRAPLSEFVKERNELAKSLRKSGERESADRIKALAKPSLTAWAVNQLAFRAKAELEGLIAAGAKVRAAHLAATEDQQEAARKRRVAISTLMSVAEFLLTEAGHTMSRAHRQKISRTLEVLASRGADSDELRAGRLSRDLEPAGFDAITDLAAALEAARASRPRRLKKTEPPVAETAPKKRSKVVRIGAKPVVEKPPAAEPVTEPEPESEAEPGPTAAERAQAAAEERRRIARRAARERRVAKARNVVRALEEKMPELTARSERADAELEQAERGEAELTAAALAAERRAREARERADAAGEATRKARLEAESSTAAARRAEGQLAEAREELRLSSDDASDPRGV